MKIIGLHIYGYGKFENVKFNNLSANIQVFYGKNEAGKSTLMSFILSILFGFPTKQQNEQRYEPKTTQSYGGKLIVGTEKFGLVTIERLPGKAVGDVRVQLQDGSIHGEELLHELLSNLDRSYYQSIFSFNVHGLQNIHRLSSDDLGRFLFSSGAIGTDALLLINQKLEKNLESLFKPNGKKPFLNLELQQLKDMNQKVKKLKEKNETYYLLMEDKEALQNELLQIEQLLIDYQQKLKTYEFIQSIKPLLKEKNNLNESLQELPSYEPFPIDGLKRLDGLLSQLQPYNTQLVGLNERKSKWEKRIKELLLDEDILKYDQEIQSLNRLRNIYEENKLKLQQLNNVRKNRIEEIEQQKELIHTEAAEEEIMKFDTSLVAKEHIKQTSSTLEGLRQRKRILDQSFNDAKDALEDCDLKIKGYEDELLPEGEQRQLEREYDRFKSRGHRNNVKESLLKSIDQNDRKRVNIETSKNRQMKKGFGIFLVIALVLLGFSIYLFTAGTWTSGLFPLLFAFVTPIIYFSLLKQSTSSMLSELQADKMELIKQLKELTPDVESFNDADYNEVQVRLSKNSQVQQLLEVERANFGQLERSYDRIVNQYEIWEQEYFKVKKKLVEQCEKYKIPETSEQLIDIYNVIVRLKQCIREKNECIEQINLIKSQIEEFDSMIKFIGEACKVEVDQSDSLIVLERINQAIKQQTSVLEELTHTTKKVEEIDEDVAQLQSEVNFVLKDVETLLAQANVQTEEEFRRKAKVAERASRIKERLLLVDAQLSSYPLVEEEWLDALNDERKIEKVEIELRHNKEKLKEIQHQLSETKIRIEELEEGGVYAEVFHDYRFAQSSFQEHAKEWAIMSVAKDLLEKTIQQYRDVRLPQLLKTAERYLTILTNGTYVRVYPKEGKAGFIIERKDGIRFTPDELSQATAEQIYVAIRFALAKTISVNEKVPFLIDDSFVNFDGKRLENVVVLLKEISNNQQVMFFTCHEHVVSLFNPQECISLSELRA
ncbi:ATP-binding protein [Litchfieldia salsa]|uniref:Uncharacterized protein YhaN n=1 Tax=Litchfieldia salsa TaxID=930152 RepID=A0A1H0UW18_9BACI|nr:AAA family ATPase [Litchfieldia salsa]SDP70367.1 Uncharacterized protein YhaN [Litchfieldia salsa]